MAVGAAVVWCGGIALPITNENLLFLEVSADRDEAICCSASGFAPNLLSPVFKILKVLTFIL